MLRGACSPLLTMAVGGNRSRLNATVNPQITGMIATSRKVGWCDSVSMDRPTAIGPITEPVDSPRL